MADIQSVIRLPITPLPTFPNAEAYAAGVAALRKAWERMWRSPTIARGTVPPIPARDEEVLRQFFSTERETSGVVTLDGIPDSGHASAYATVALDVLAPFVTPGAIGFLDTSCTEVYAVFVDARGARGRDLVPAPETPRRKRTRR